MIGGITLIIKNLHKMAKSTYTGVLVNSSSYTKPYKHCYTQTANLLKIF